VCIEGIRSASVTAPPSIIVFSISLLI
jgi:hypothetical protein